MTGPTVPAAANIVRDIRNRPARARSSMKPTVASTSAGSSRPASTRSSARLRIEKQPGGTGSRSGSQLDQRWVCDVAPMEVTPAASRSAPSRRPTFDGLDRSTRNDSSRRRSRSPSPISSRSVDQSVSIRLTRPPSRTTRASSRTAAAGSGTHCSTRSQRAASKDASGSARASASPSEKRVAHRASSARRRATASIAALASTPTSSPVAPRSVASASPASPSPQPTSRSRAPGCRSRWRRSHRRSSMVAGHSPTTSIVPTSTGTFAASSTTR